MYNINPQKNDIVDIYFNPKSDDKRRECQGILIEKVESECYTFTLDYEKLEHPNTYSLSIIGEEDSTLFMLNNIYEYLHHYFAKQSQSIITFKSELMKACSRDIHSYNNMYMIIEKVRRIFADTTDVINNILSIDNKYIIRYIQQTKLQKWTPSLFELQKWKVKLIDINDRFFIPFVAYRNIVAIKKICPTDKVISDYTTSGSASKYI